LFKVRIILSGFLLKHGIQESDILAGIENVPKISYLNSNGSESKYSPDVYLLHDNILMEVKSPYIYQFDQDRIKSKIQAVIRL